MFKQGYLIVDTTTVKGGIVYKREIIDAARVKGVGAALVSRVTRATDHDEACRLVDGVQKRVFALLRQHCLTTGLGWVTDAAGLARVQEGMTGLRRKMATVNATAADVGCGRRARIGYATFPLRTPEAFVEVAYSISAVLTEIQSALQSGCILSRQLCRTLHVQGTDRLHGPMLRAKNLTILAADETRSAIGAALECIRDARLEILARIKLGEEVESAGASVDLRPIEACIKMLSTRDEPLLEVVGGVL